MSPVVKGGTTAVLFDSSRTKRPTPDDILTPKVARAYSNPDFQTRSSNSTVIRSALARSSQPRSQSPHESQLELNLQVDPRARSQTGLQSYPRAYPQPHSLKSRYNSPHAYSQTHSQSQASTSDIQLRVMMAARKHHETPHHIITATKSPTMHQVNGEIKGMRSLILLMIWHFSCTGTTGQKTKDSDDECHAHWTYKALY